MQTDNKSSYPINTDMMWITVVTPDGNEKKIKVRAPRHTRNTKPNTTNFVVRFTDNEGVEHNIADFHINFPVQNQYGEIIELISRMITMLYLISR